MLSMPTIIQHAKGKTVTAMDVVYVSSTKLTTPCLLTYTEHAKGKTVTAIDVVYAQTLLYGAFMKIQVFNKHTIWNLLN